MRTAAGAFVPAAFSSVRNSCEIGEVGASADPSGGARLLEVSSIPLRFTSFRPFLGNDLRRGIPLIVIFIMWIDVRHRKKWKSSPRFSFRYCVAFAGTGTHPVKEAGLEFLRRLNDQVDIAPRTAHRRCGASGDDPVASGPVMESAQRPKASGIW